MIFSFQFNSFYARVIEGFLTKVVNAIRFKTNILFKYLAKNIKLISSLSRKSLWIN